jgi:DNA-binding MarR family transcriptional regulator
MSAPPAPRDDAIEDLPGLLKAVLDSIAHQADRRLAPHGLTLAQWHPLHALHCGSGATAGALARSIRGDPGAVTRALHRLESRQMVRRLRSTTDRRIVHLALTPRGHEAAAIFPGVLAEVLNDHLAGFSHGEWRELLRMLRRMATHGASVDASRDTAE